MLSIVFVPFVNKVFRKIVGIPMRMNCAPLIADLYLYCYESQFMAKRPPPKRPK